MSSHAARKKIGQQTSYLQYSPTIKGTGTVVGPKEGNGPLAINFHEITQDELLGMSSWEQAESEFLYRACQHALGNAKLDLNQIDYLFSGDLLNQTVSSNLVAKKLQIPYFGLFGACSTMAEGLLLSSIMVDGGMASNVLTATSSHNKGLERQFRFPTEYGGQRPPYAQWTVSGGGAAIISHQGNGPYVSYVTPGKVMDWGVSDAYDLGSAMAPAAYDTLKQHLSDTGQNVTDYDMIVTGDLGIQGTTMFKELCENDGINVQDNHYDCGVMIFDSNQDVHAGASGCACSAVVTYSYIYNLFQNNKINRALVMATGALHNPQIVQQNITIPTICHAVALEQQKIGDSNG
ncbi:stage V sporulation protein AD [Natranaerobius thermophilus]|uniref:Stage V sporulation protein AD n=1 Tax=Natranaerobius thermophilus (strain ATCC BAA-1301 / DSM 18059 / JW/NM-WN-LF) TaxID=457570 RepID=B2A4Z0_NATTJ|nr:stage V sporulation protein AD [Natranaerobius thermophilus]ACB85232.1 stage V sporulation protein AD [Natranaerobius thermophilus JW/NM-WN-LF]